MKNIFIICCFFILIAGPAALAEDTVNTPVISSVTPSIIARGEVITIQGRGLTGEGARTSVKIDGKEVPYLSYDAQKGIMLKVDTNPSLEQRIDHGEYERTVVVSIDDKDSAPIKFRQLTWNIIFNARVLIPLIIYIVVAVSLISEKGLFRSKTKELSLSKIQMGVWTFVFGLVYIILSAGRMEFLDITEGMFWLMGISSTTAAGAKAIVIKNKIGIPDKPSTLLHDWDDNAGAYTMSLHRAQIFLWTLIVLAIYIVKTIDMMNLPEIPGNLMILMGISGGTYLGFNYTK
jgi:hypothetical protein